MLLSKYVKIIDYNENCILYNTIKHSLIMLPKNIIKERELIDEFIDEESNEEIARMGFYNFDDKMIEANIEKYTIKKEKMFISVELNLSCNLKCPYCYQIGKKNSNIVSDSDIDNLIQYFIMVYKKQKFKELYLKILGGEPTLVWNKFMLLYNKSREFCEERQIKFNVLIDTNGTDISNIIELNNYDSLLITIPLSYKDAHDKVRFDSKGNGTYDKIIDNINEIKRKKEDAKIVIRYNVDNYNINFFKDFLFDIKEKLIFKPLISVNYTAEFNGSDEFKNKLSYSDFIEWSSSTAIDNLVEAELPITISPIISIEECQFRSKYSLKLFSDGTVGSCAMSFFDKNREKIEDVIKNIDNNLLSRQKTCQTIMEEKDCLKCDSLFICGGTNKLPCIKKIEGKMCENKKFTVDIDKFIIRYMKYKEIGKGDLFVVFQNGESYR